MSKRVLITGAAGFIGSHVVARLLDTSDAQIICMDRLDFSGNQKRLAEVMAERHSERKRGRMIFHDLRAEINDHLASQIGVIDYVIHLAAGTHVDRSIAHPMQFVQDNVVGTANLLQYVRLCHRSARVFIMSTDEVFGPVTNKYDRFMEWDRFHPNNPYAATKAAAEMLCHAWAHTYGMDIVIGHCQNVFGERQHPEKFVPLCIRKILNGEQIQIHSDPSRSVSGSRFYLHAADVAEAILFLLQGPEKLQTYNTGVYNIVSEQEWSNLGVALAIANILDRPLHYDMVDAVTGRPGHDLRYALDGTLLRKLGWKPSMVLDTALEQTVKWTVENKDRWL